ncbi:MAG: 3-deoxy-D-manno-octulosonic acid transferase [Longimicrobiales bacterium]
MAMLDRLYGMATRAAASALHVATPFNAKLARGVAARRDALAHIESWARTARDPARPLVWLHAPSVGEALMAQAIAASLRSRHPELQLALTIFSPSAERVLDHMPVDVSGYLPWDTPREAVATARALRPAAVGFVRTEVWPLMMAAAQRGGARVALVNAVLAPSSSRLRWPARALLSDVYAQLDAVGVVSDAHASRFRLLGVMPGQMQVTGDARFDQVLRRVAAIDRASPMLQCLRGDTRTVLVAGSTWPLDERALVTGVGALVREGRLRLVVAPHEPGPAHLEALEAMLNAATLPHARLSAVEQGSAANDAPVILVDRLGVLADLYAAADMAYIGGGFGDAGLHSVVEPAALGVPVICGPRHGNAIEAAELARSGGCVLVVSADALGAQVEAWLSDAPARAAAGDAAQAFTQARAGGADANALLLAGLAGLAPR